MKSTRIIGATFACVALSLPIWAVAQVSGPYTYAFTAASQSNVWTCNTGQSSFALTVPSGLTGTFTVTVSQSSGGTYINPPWAHAPGSATYVNTITNSGSLTVTLGSNQYVKVADTSYSSGSVTVTGVCSSAVAVIPPQPTASPFPTVCPSAGANVTVSGSYPCTIAASTSTPAPTPSPVAGSNVTITGSYPYTIAATTPSPAPTAYPTPFTQLACSGNIVCSPSAGPSPSVAETNAPTWTGTATAPQFVGNAAAATPSPAPTGYYGPAVIAQATSAPTFQPGYIGIANISTQHVNNAYFVSPIGGSSDDTSDVQAAINQACPTPGGNAIGYVQLSAGTFNISSTLTQTCNGLWIYGMGQASRAASAGPVTSLKWTGAASGTILLWAPPSGATGAANIENGGIQNLNFATATSPAAATALKVEGAFGPTFSGLSMLSGFTGTVMWLTYDANLTIPGTSNVLASNIEIDGFSQTNSLWLDGAYNNTFINFSADYGNGDGIKIGDGTTSDDESDTDTFIHAQGYQAASYTGTGVELACGSSNVSFYDALLNPQSTGHNFVARGTSSCSGKALGASYQNVVVGEQPVDFSSVAPDIETGAQLAISQTNGQTAFTNVSGSQAALSFNSNIPSYNGFTSGSAIFSGQMDADNPWAFWGNTTGSNGYTVLGSNSAMTCSGISGDVLAAYNHGSGSALCFDGVNLGLMGGVSANGAIEAGASPSPSPPAGALGSAVTASSGEVTLGGSSSACTIDYGVTVASKLTIPCANVKFTGAAVNAPSGVIAWYTHNACSATSETPCSFSWSATMSSGAGSTTQAVPASSVCTVTFTETPVLSTTNVASVWAPAPVSTTLTVYIHDELGTSSATLTGNGTCL